MYSQLLVVLIGTVLFAWFMKYGVSLWIHQRKRKISILSFLSIDACFMGVILAVASLVEAFFFPIELMFSVGIPVLGTIGAYLSHKYVKNKTANFISTVSLCTLGVFLLPIGVSFPFDGFVNILCYIAAISLWVLFIYLMQLFDKVPLMSFSSFASLFLSFSFVSSILFAQTPTSIQTMCLMFLSLLAVFSFMLKKGGLFSLGPSFVFLASYISGFIFIWIAAKGNALYLPIFVAYQLGEFLLALCVNLYLYKKLYPIQVPFLIEKVFASGVNISLLIKKLFWTCFFFAFLGFVGIYLNQKNVNVMNVKTIYVLYVCVGILLLNMYMIFTSWGQPKVKFRNLFSDIKNELKKTKSEVNDLVKNASKKNKK